MTMFIAMVTGFIALLGPVIGGFVPVAIYGGASTYFEPFPERAERFVRGRDAKRIAYHPDLDDPGIPAPGVSRGKTRPRRSPANPELAEPTTSLRRERC